MACVICGCGSGDAQPIREPATSSAGKQFVYVFSVDGAYLKLDGATLSAVGDGTVNEATASVVYAVVPDPERRDLVILTGRAWLPNARPAPGIAIVGASTTPGASSSLRAVRAIAPPAGMDQITGAIMTRGDRRMLVATWDGPRKTIASPSTLVFTAEGDFRDSRRIENFVVGLGSCAAPDGSQIYTPSSRELREIQVLNTHDLTVRRIQPPPHDIAGFSPIDMATGGSCRILVVGRSSTSSPGSRQVPAYLYDLENQRVVQRLTFPERGEYSVSPDGSLVVVDERIVVPNVLPSGRTVGQKYKKTGVLRTYDAAAGRELSTATLPEDGWLSATEGSTGYYVSPGLLSVVDLRNGKITTTATLPFATGLVAFHEER